MSIRPGGPSKTVLDGTYQSIVKSRGPLTDAAAQLMDTLDQGLRSCAIGVLADSTGFSATANRWPYLLGQSLGALYPAYTVKHRAWNQATTDYDVPTVIQTGTAGGERAVTMTANSTAAMADSAATSPTGDIDLRIRVALDAWTPGAEVDFISKFGAAGQRTFRWLFGSGNGVGNMNFQTSADGTTLLDHFCPAAWSRPADGGSIWLRVTLQVNNAAAGHTVVFYTSTDGVTWTQIGSPVVTAGVTSLFDSTTELMCSGRGGYSAPGAGIVGKVYHVEVRNGIAGKMVAPTLPELWPLQLVSGVRALLPTTGPPVLNIINSAQSGAAVTDLNSTSVEPIRLPDFGTSLVLISLGHNDTGNSVPFQWQIGDPYLSLYDTLLTQAQAQLPRAAVAFVSQNPRTSPATGIPDHAIRQAQLVGWARQNRLGLVDTYRAFAADTRGLGVLVNSDGIHPSDAAGSPLWRDTVLTELLRRGM